MAANRPIRTVTALRKLLGSRWDSLTSLEVSDTAIKVGFAAPASFLVHEKPVVFGPVHSDKPTELQEPPLNDADLALSPPAGMLVPPPADEPN